MTWKTRQLRQVQAAKGAAASSRQTRASDGRFAAEGNEAIWHAVGGARCRQHAGTSVTPTSAPSGRKQRGIGDGKGEGQGACPIRPAEGAVLEAGGGPECKRNAEDGEGFGERLGGVDGGKGTQGREPKRGVESTVSRRGWTDAMREEGQQYAADKFDRDLEAGGSVVVLHAEEPEAGGEKEWISGQADQRGDARCPGCRRERSARGGAGFLPCRRRVPSRR